MLLVQGFLLMLEAGVPAFVSVDVVDSVVIFSLRGATQDAHQFRHL